MAHNNGHYFINEAAKHGFKVRRGKGDHVIVIPPRHENNLLGPADRNYMVIPDRELGDGLCAKIRKWFLKLGIIVCLAAIAFFVGVLEGVL